MIKKIIKTKKACPSCRIVGSRRGNTIVETLFYIVIFAMLSIAVINAMITMMKSFKETKVQREIIQSGEIMERISREIKQANNISSLTSSDLILNTKDGAGANKLVEFVLTNSDIQFLENGAFTGNLNSPNITAQNLSFSQINTVAGRAVKVFLTIRAVDDSLNRNYDFYDTLVLRGSY